MFKKRNMVDERQELQSLKNARTCWTITMVLLMFSMLVQMGLLAGKPMYYLPEAVILLIAAITNLVLEIKHGLVYTSDWSNPKKVYLLYFAASMAAGIIMGVTNYMRYDFPALWILLIAAFVFISCLVLMLIADRLVKEITRERLQKLEREADRDADSEN